MTRTCDTIVIGAGTNGLAAAAYLAMAGKRVVVLEARERVGGLCETVHFGDGFKAPRAAHALFALDPVVLRELKLGRHGLGLSLRDMALVGLRGDGRHLMLSRDAAAAQRQIALHSEADASAWPEYRQEWNALARRMRALWWRTGRPEDAAKSLDARIARLACTGAAAWLDGRFESDALKATLGFDAHALSPLAAGSALLLLWRAAQEMSGLQGAVAVPRGGFGALAEAFAGAARARGAEIRTSASVTRIATDDKGAAKGVVLASGEEIAAPLILSSLSRRATYARVDEPAALGFGIAAESAGDGTQLAHVALALDGAVAISGSAVPANARFVIMERLDSLVAAHAAARAGEIPQELTMEATVPTALDASFAPEGRSIVSVVVAPVPAEPDGGWSKAKPMLAARVVAALGHHIPGLARRLVGADILAPEDLRERYGADDGFGGPVDVGRLLSGWRARVMTPIDGLLLCGAAADPCGAVSGRGGRMAACYALERECRR